MSVIKRSKKLPTDLQILDVIYDRYYETFTAFTGDQDRASKLYVPIDIADIAKGFGVDNDIVFGRLYYHLDKQHRYQQENGAYVHLFTLESGGDRHCVNFPLLAAVLAPLREDLSKYRWATGAAVFGLIVSIVALVVSFVK